MVLTCPLLGLFKWLLPIPFLLLFSVTAKGGPSQACAACKYQRRRCTPDCALAPFFPADQPKIFQNAHRLYGVANMMRILNNVRDDEKDDAMQSIKFESNMWERYPFKGCCDVIDHLGAQVRAHMAEFHYVHALIQMVRNRHDNSPWAQLKQLSLNPNYGVSANYPHCDEGTSYDAEMKPLWAQQQQQLQAQMTSRALMPDDSQSYKEAKEEYDLSRCSNGSSALNVAMQSTTVKTSSQDELESAPPWLTHLSLVPSDNQDH